MTGQEPAPEAVEAVALSMHGTLPCDAHRDDQCYYTNHATHALAFIRDAIHRDGDDANAIREALGLSWAPLMGGRILSGEWQEVPW